MQGQDLVCPVCYDEFDSKKKAPRIIPTCGHTICAYCLEKILCSYTKRCPLDKQWLPNDKYNIHQYPVNYILTQALENKVEVQICEIHKEPLQMACFTDNCLVCEDCVWQGDHKDHQVKTIKKVRKDLLAKNNSVEERVTHVDEIYKQLKEKMTQSKHSVESEVKKKFAEINKLVAEKEKKYLLQVSLIYCEGMGKLESFIGGSSELKQNISQKTEWMNTNFQGNEFFELYQIDFSAFLSKIDSLLSMIPSAEYKIDTTPTLEAFHHSFGELESLLCKHEASFASLFDEITSFEPKTLNINSFDDIPLLPCFEARSSIEVILKQQSETLELFTRKREAIEQKLDGSLWRKNHELRVNFENYELTEQDEKVLEYTFQKLPKLRSLKLNFLPGGDLDDNRLIDIFSIVFGKPEDLEEIDIDLEKNKVSDRSLMVLLEKYIPLMPNLKIVGLNLSATDVTSKTVEALVSGEHPLIFKNLTKLKLYLNKLPIDDNAMAQVCVALPKVTSLQLGFAGTKITGKALETLSKNTVMGTYKALKTLELDFSETGIHEKFLGVLFANLGFLKNLKEFGLNLRKTAATTDFTVTRLVELGLPKIPGLMNLNVDIRDTKVSLKALAQLDKAKKKVTKPVL